MGGLCTKDKSVVGPAPSSRPRDAPLPLIQNGGPHTAGTMGQRSQVENTPNERIEQPTQGTAPSGQPTVSTDSGIYGHTLFPDHIIQQKNFPKKTPPTKLKGEVFNINDYQKVDDYAVSISDSSLSDFKDLVKSLTKNFKTDTEKARSLYRWLTTRDCRSYKKHESNCTTPRGFLSAIEADVASYADMYYVLCSMAGLPSMVIEGYGKGVGYQPGQRITTDEFNTTWVSVAIDGCWRLFDPHWGARHVVGDDKDSEWQMIDSEVVSNSKGKKKSEVSHDNDEFYFMTDPGEMVYSHIPFENCWQLADKSISKERFEDIAFVKSNFFTLGLKIQSHPLAICHTDNGEIALKFYLPMNRILSFTYRLFKWADKDSRDSSTNNNINLNRYVLQQYDNTLISFEMRLPEAGKFLVEVFSREEFRGSDIDNKVMGQICAYIITCDIPKTDCQPYPMSSSTRGYGPGAECKRSQLIPTTHRSGIIETDTGDIEILFESQDGEMDFVHSLSSNKYNSDALQHNAVHRAGADGKTMVFNVNVPEIGEYSFDVFGKKKGKDGLYPHVFSYMIRCTGRKSKPLMYPLVANGYYGPHPVFNKLGCSSLHKDALIIAPPSGEVKIKLSQLRALEFVAELIYQDDNNAVEMNDHVFCDKMEDLSTFTANVSKPGYYKLEVYGKEPNTKGSLPNIYNFLIYNGTEKPSNIFPKAFLAWGTGFRLYEPRRGVLPAGDTVPFSVVVPRARNVAVVCGDKWTPLHKEDDEDDIWEGEVTCCPGDHELRLAAAIDDDKNYSILLSYKLGNAEELKKAQDQQIAHGQLVAAEEKRERLKENEKELKKKDKEKKISRKAKALAVVAAAEIASTAAAQAEQDLVKAKKAADKASKEGTQEDAEKQLRLAKAKALEAEHDKYRHQLKAALASGNKEELEEGIKMFRKHDIPDIDGDFAQAQQILNADKLQKDLEKACDEREMEDIEKVLDTIKKSGYEGMLRLEVARALRILQTLRNIAKYRHAIMLLDFKSIAEIKSYKVPPDGVHEVLTATYRLLGEPHSALRDWPSAVILISKLGKDRPQRRIGKFDLFKCDQKIALECQNMIKPFSQEIVCNLSVAVAAFYMWVKGVTKEIIERDEDDDDPDKKKRKSKVEVPFDSMFH